MNVEILDGMLKGINTTLLGLIESHPEKEYLTTLLTLSYVKEMEKDLTDNYQLGYELTLGKLVHALREFPIEEE